MFIRRKSTSLAVASIAALLASYYSHTILAADPATMPSVKSNQVTKCQLTLAPQILDPRQNAVGAIHGSNIFPHTLELTDQRPMFVTKEPKYVGRPEYGVFKIGDGSKSLTYFAIDEAKGFEGKIYVDQNQNGDLTDDGPGEWDERNVRTDFRFCEKVITVHASWGNPLTEKESGTYTFLVTKTDGMPEAGFIKMTGRIGNIKMGDKTYPIVLGENMGDGLYTVPADGDLTRPPVSLYIDTDNMTSFETPTNKDGSQRYPEKFDISHAFQIEEHWYIARPSITGNTLMVQETVPPGQSTPPPAVAPDKNPVGSIAPNFTIQTPDGKPLSLADYKGKLVILDFWATWCRPCQASMPDLEKLYQRVKDQDVVVLSVNVQDEKQPFDSWIKKHANQDYHFDFGFDPAGRGDTSLTSSTYEVHAIPVCFLISRDGKIAAKTIGVDVGEHKLTKALREQGVKIKAD